MKKTCTGSTQAKCQHGKQEMSTKSHPSLRSYWQLTPAGKGESVSPDARHQAGHRHQPYCRAAPCSGTASQQNGFHVLWVGFYLYQNFKIRDTHNDEKQ